MIKINIKIMILNRIKIIKVVDFTAIKVIAKRMKDKKDKKDSKDKIIIIITKIMEKIIIENHIITIIQIIKDNNKEIRNREMEIGENQ